MLHGSGVGYRKRFLYASLGKIVLIVGWGNFGQFKDAFELRDRPKKEASYDPGP